MASRSRRKASRSPPRAGDSRCAEPRVTEPGVAGFWGGSRGDLGWEVRLRWARRGADSRYMLSSEQPLSARSRPEPVPAGASQSRPVAKPARRGLVLAAAFMCVAAASAIPAAGLDASRHPGRAVDRAPSQAQPPGLLGEATHEYDTMTATRYQAALRVDLSKGTYFYDCVGFVTYALGQVAPQARTTIMTKFNIAPNRIPSPARYVDLFGQLDGTQPGWQPVHRVVDLQPGDVVAWTYTNPHGANGHAFVVGSVPKAVGTG